ncbi:MAG: TetR/AcrR family transcriptional regulator [Pseudomonadota bacterium]
MSTKSDPNIVRKSEILTCGLAVLVEKGWRGTSMIAVASKANASKETLYKWFGDKSGFFAAMIRENAKALDASLPNDFSTMPLEEGLHAFGTEFLKLVTGDTAIAINRAAIAEAGHDPNMGQTLLQEGKATSLPKLADWLSNHLDLKDPLQAAERFVVLVKGDTQLECLLGATSRPSKERISAQVSVAVTDFLKLYT